MKYRKNQKENNSIKIEKFFIIVFLITFISLIIVQIGLVNEYSRKYLYKYDDLEGVSLGIEETLYSQGYIELEYLNKDQKLNPVILLNGEESKPFKDNKLTLNVKNGDVIEIEGTDTTENAYIQVISQSDNIIDSFLNKKYKISAKTTKIMQINIK